MFVLPAFVVEKFIRKISIKNQIRSYKMFRKCVIILLSLFLCTSFLSANPSGKIQDYSTHSPFAYVAEDVIKTVVNIKVEWEAQIARLNPQIPDEFFKFFFQPQPRQKRKSVGFGSGFIYKQTGNEIFIITNNHLFSKANEPEITVTLSDESEYNAEIVGTDGETDLALIKAKVDKDKQISTATLGNSDSLWVGDWVIAIGNPLRQDLSGTLTLGVVSAKGRANLNFGKDSPVYQDYIQTDAAINPGNSGGPLVNINGEVVGVNAAISTVSGGNIGIGFAIPINIVKTVINDLEDKGYVERAYLGILPQEITPILQDKLDLESSKGVLIGHVEKNTPADDAGLQKRDVIIAINGQLVSNVSKFRIMIADEPVGSTVRLKIVRNGDIITKRVKLSARPENTIAKAEEMGKDTQDWLGISISNITPQLTEKFNINVEEGVVVTGIRRNSSAEDSALNIGDVILEIENIDIKDENDFYEAVQIIKEKNQNSILLYINSGKNFYRYLTIRL